MEENEIKEARLAAGLTQKSMSDITGIPLRTIGNWESGHRCPPDWTKKLVVDELNRIKKKGAE